MNFDELPSAVNIFHKNYLETLYGFIVFILLK